MQVLKPAYLLTPLLLLGCTMGGVINISEPYLTEPGLSLQAGVLKLEDIEISIKPQTYKVGLLAFGPLIPVIPVGPGNDYDRQSQDMKVLLQFESSRDDFSFAPSDAHLMVDGKEVTPSGSTRVLTEIVYPREAAKATPGHSWICDLRRAKIAQTEKEPLVLTEPKSCVVLEFPVITPETDSEFSIILKGLKRNATPISVPTFHFKPGTAGSYVIMG